MHAIESSPRTGNSEENTPAVHPYAAVAAAEDCAFAASAEEEEDEAFPALPEAEADAPLLFPPAAVPCSRTGFRSTGALTSPKRVTSRPKTQFKNQFQPSPSRFLWDSCMLQYAERQVNQPAVFMS